MSTVRYEILLPLRYNDGASVEQEKFMITRRELLARFEGLTMEPQGFRGIWIDEGIECEKEQKNDGFIITARFADILPKGVRIWPFH